MSYPRRYIDGVTVLVVHEAPNLTRYGLRRSRVPLGVPFRDAGAGWALIDLVPWEQVPPEERAGDQPCEN